jgi:Protein of unknown function (DUF1091)
MQIRNYLYTPKKVWKIGNVNVNIDYCEFAKGANNPLLAVFAPGLREQYGNMFRPCPYEGVIDVENYTIETDKFTTRMPKGTKIKIEVKFLANRKVPVFGFMLFNKVV